MDKTFVIFVSPLLMREKLTRKVVLCTGIVLFGMLLMNLKNLNAGGDHFGLFCGAMTCLMYAVLVLANKQATSITGLTNSTIQVVASFLVVAVYNLLRHNLEMPSSGTEWSMILILGAVNTGFGCFLYFSSIGTIPAQRVSIMGYIEPMTAVVTSALFLGESFSLLKLGGILLILLGAYMMVSRAPQGTKSSSPAIPHQQSSRIAS